MSPTGSEGYLEGAYRCLLESSDWQQHFVRSKSQPLSKQLTKFLHVHPSVPTTVLQFQTSGLDGSVVGFDEISDNAPQLLTATNSTSLLRFPSDPSAFVRGKSGHLPFLPSASDSQPVTDQLAAKNHALEISQYEMQTIAPGFVRGLDFSIGMVIRLHLGLYGGLHSNHFSDKFFPTKVFDNQQPDHLSILDDELSFQLSPQFRPTNDSNRKASAIAKRQWAHVVDVNSEMTNFDTLVPQLAKQFPFSLDNFQKEAIYHMEQGDSVFVAAHTSAGKTVVAEYAIALATRHMTKAVYTSPIKALSNQKFRDFKNTFGASSVGILTGDVQINPEGSCLIMTTEILRSMLYKGADLIRDVEWVIFDEVHYVNDLERGVVWEEVIIMLPDHVNIVLLSATVPNTQEFADWVGRTKKKDIFVINTPKRPVPLEHYLYAGRELHKIVDQKGSFIGQGWKDATDSQRRKQEKDKPNSTDSRGNSTRRARVSRGSNVRGRAVSSTNMTVKRRQDASLWVHLVGLLRKKDLLPVVVFAFSKKRCEEYAASMPNTDFCVASEKSEIHVVLERSLARLQGGDKELPQIKNMQLLLSRGIGVHHGGLLPIVKEMVEILFARGLVKVLFATETFAMGVNMPARCVVFAAIRKHDGKSLRDISSGEYTQMAGRAGRRGLDATGVVIIVCEPDIADTPTLIKLILGTPTKLSSQFRLKYNMILNLLRVEALRVEDMIKRSFSENASQRLLPEQERELQKEEARLSALEHRSYPSFWQDLRLYYDLTQEIIRINANMIREVVSQAFSTKVFCQGRVFILADHQYRNVPAVIISASKSAGFRNVWAFLLTNWNQEHDTDNVPIWPPSVLPQHGVEPTYHLDYVSLSSIALVTRFIFKLPFDPNRLKRSDLLLAANSFHRFLSTDLRSTENIELEWEKNRELDFLELLTARGNIVSQRDHLDCRGKPDFDTQYRKIHAEKEIENRIMHLKQAISEQNLDLLPEYEQMIAVLRQLQFIDSNSTVLLKGRVACEINSGHELIITELVFNNTFGSFQPEEIVSLLSPFIFQEKTEISPILSPRLEEGRNLIMETTDRVLSVCPSMNDDSQGSVLHFGLMEVVYEWARGMPFEEITTLTDVQEGTIVRTITRLDETCREIKDAARIVGNSELFAKMETAQQAIRRDVVFCASLYF